MSTSKEKIIDIRDIEELIKTSGSRKDKQKYLSFFINKKIYIKLTNLEDDIIILSVNKVKEVFMENKKVILVTGASRGIGRNIALTLAKEGHIVIANYNKSVDAAKSLEEETKGHSLEIYKADVTNENEVKDMLQYIENKYNKIDVVINNAGISQEKLFTDLTFEDWDNMMKNNLYSAFYVSRESAKLMIRNHVGLIINISSIWGQIGASMEVHYSVSKAGLDGLTKALAKELGPSNIRVNSIAPGFIDTDMNKHLSKEDVDAIKNETPLGKVGKVEDISKAVKWLVEDEFTTGQVISINGGWGIF